MKKPTSRRKRAGRRPPRGHRAEPRRRAVGRLRRRPPQHAPRTLRELYRRSAAFQDQWVQMTNAVSLMRSERIPLRVAAARVGLSPQIIMRLAGRAIRKQSNGRYAVTARDQLLRPLVIPTTNGLRDISVRDSQVATRIAEYWNAVHRYLARGDLTALAIFEGITVKDASGKTIRLLTDRRQLDRLAGAGVLSFETIYARSA